MLEVGSDAVEVRRRGRVDRVIERSTVDAVYMRGAKVVLETASGRNLFKDDIEEDRSVIRAAFVEHGYRWEGDRQ